MTGKATLKKGEKTLGNIFKIIFNKVVAGFIYLISLLPFKLLYFISDILYFFLRFIFRYRRKVIFDNITFAFPEKSEIEIKAIIKKFYKHLADLIMEVIKLRNISEKELDKRLSYNSLELAEKYYRENKSIIVLAMHHNNWEWCSFMQTKVDHFLFMVYNPVRGSKSIENFMLRSRERWGGQCVPENKSARLVLDFHQRGKPSVLWLGADQTAPVTSKFWTLFLNREAPFFSGPEKIAVKTNQPVFFHHIRKVSRGHYESDFIPLVKNPAEVEPNEILLRYIRKMEEIIAKEPEYYLWSHRRWKHKRPEGTPLITSV